MTVRGKWLVLSKHAREGMDAERPPVDEYDVHQALADPDKDHEGKALRWIQGRTILVYYEETETQIYVRSVSATRRRLAP